MTTPIAKGFGQPWSTAATASSLEVPNPFSVAIGGHPYEVVNSADGTEKWGVRFEVESVPLLRDQADQSDEPGEQSISPTMLWRRTQDSWHLGAGQSRYDRKTSNRYRFNTSKGINPWTIGQLTLLPMATPGLPMGASTGACFGQVVGSNYYVIDNARIRRCSQTDYNTWAPFIGYSLTLTSTSITGVTATHAPNAVASDGNKVWISYGQDGLWQTDPSITTASAWLTGNVTALGYAKGRIFACTAPAGGTSGILYNPLPAATGALSGSTYSFDPGSIGFTWTAIGEGVNCAYAGGYNGDQSRIYAITVNAAGTGLNVPLIAATLPPGEIVRSIYSYLNYTLIGTDKGVRFAVADSNNNLQLGALIPTNSPVYDFEGQDRFVWFTWTNYDSLSTGLGRLDLKNFTDDLTPAYASDIMTYTDLTDAPGGPIVVAPPSTPFQGTVRTVGTWLGKRVFTVDGPTTASGYNSGGGAFIEHPLGHTPPSGTINTGAIGFGVGDSKMAVYADARHDPLNGVVIVQMTTDTGTPTALGANKVQGSTGATQPYPANQIRGAEFALDITLSHTPDGTDNGTTLYPVYTGSPLLHSWTLRAIPLPQRILQWTVPLTFASKVHPNRGAARAMDVDAERSYLRSLYKSGDLVPYQETNTSTLVQVYDMNEILTKLTEDHLTYESIFVVVLREAV